MLTQTKKIVKISRNANTELAHNLVREYKQTRWVQNSERIGKPDTLSARYSSHDFVGNPNVLTWLLGRAPTSFEEWARTQYENYRATR